LQSDKIRDYQKQNNGKIAGYAGAVWCRHLVFDIDCKGGTIEENIEKALLHTRNLCIQLKEATLSPAVKFSGCHGFHTVISSLSLDDISGFPDTPQRAKDLALMLAAGTPIDDAIYDKPIKLIRSQNSINPKSGLYAIPIREGELFRLSSAQILELARKPRRPVQYPVKAFMHLIGKQCVINENGTVDFEDGVSFSVEEIDKLKNEKDKEAIKNIYTVKKLFHGEIQ
jgi:hypothetical protein